MVVYQILLKLRFNQIFVIIEPYTRFRWDRELKPHHYKVNMTFQKYMYNLSEKGVDTPYYSISKLAERDAERTIRAHLHNKRCINFGFSNTHFWHNIRISWIKSTRKKP